MARRMVVGLPPFMRTRVIVVVEVETGLMRSEVVRVGGLEKYAVPGREPAKQCTG